MVIPYFFACAAALMWSATLARRATPVLMTLALILGGYVLGYDTWRADLGPITLTLDRLLLLAAGTTVALRLCSGTDWRTRMVGADWALLLVLGWLTLSCATHWRSEPFGDAASPANRLILGFYIPAFLYAMVRLQRFDGAAARALLIGLGAMGVYLAATALLETLRAWPLVFPRYIADPDLGLHYGRARGPGLNSVSLGVYLGATAIAATILASQRRGLQRIAWGVAAAAMSCGVMLTYTRSTWIGLALAMLLTLTLQLPRRVRKPVCVLALCAGVAFGVTAKSALVSLKREDSAAVAAHSVQQRLAFAYVSYQMFKDHPLTGVGFGRFIDKKLPYLTDRSQSFELDSIRPLEHHNTLLSLLTETGLLGLFAYIVLLTSWGVTGWRLFNLEGEDDSVRSIGLLMIGVLAVYGASAIFHDLTLIHSDQWLLFAVGGAATGALVNSRQLAGNRSRASTGAQPPDLSG